MIVDTTTKRELEHIAVYADFTIVGGGLAGCCAAITAAREGLSVILIQDRPVLGGNASSEIRLWGLGATSHMGNNNRWAREGGVIDEIMVENTFKNPEGNPVIFDMVLLDLIKKEPRIELFLNSAVYEVGKELDTITSVTAFCSQNSTRISAFSPLFLDASGDGIVGYLSGAEFRIGAESGNEFQEEFVQSEEYGELLGQTIFFYTKDAGKPISFYPPDFALKDITEIPKYREIGSGEAGCRYWWFEYGGRLDPVHDTESIKWELWRVIYGVWNYIKNSGLYPEAANHTLEWVGMIPGKRESRRFAGEYMLSQSDLVVQKQFPDAVSFGGWAIDLHPADGIYSSFPSCTQYHSKGVYQIPYRTMYSKTIKNLFITGRGLSASHIAFGSTRVMMTSAHNAQAAGMAAVVCNELQLTPGELYTAGKYIELQKRLLRVGQFIPHVELPDTENLLGSCKINCSSTLNIVNFAPSGSMLPLDDSFALLLPVQKGKLPEFEFLISAEASTQLVVELRSSSRLGNYTPDLLLEKQYIPIESGTAFPLQLLFSTMIDDDQFVCICFRSNPLVSLMKSDSTLPGFLGLFQKMNEKVSKSSIQLPPEGSGLESFEFWLPERRPYAVLPAFTATPALTPYSVEHLRNSYKRPFIHTNSWVPDADDPLPTLTLHWPEQKSIRKIVMHFDTDFDHPMESVQYAHYDRIMPWCTRSVKILSDTDRCIAEMVHNHKTRVVFEFAEPIHTASLSFCFEQSDNVVVYGIDVFAYRDFP